MLHESSFLCSIFFDFSLFLRNFGALKPKMNQIKR